MTQHWDLMVAADFFTVEVWTRRGLQRFLVLFFIDLSTRRLKRYLIHDRDPLFTAEFLEMLADIGIQPLKLPPRSPNLYGPASRNGEYEHGTFKIEPNAEPVELHQVGV